MHRVEAALKLHPTIQPALDAACLEASGQGQMHLTAYDFAPQDIDDAKAPDSRDKHRALAACLLLCFYAINRKLCDNPSILLADAPALLHCLHKLWSGASLAEQNRANDPPSTNSPLFDMHVLAQAVLRPIARNVKASRHSLDRLGALLTTLGGRSLGKRCLSPIQIQGPKKTGEDLARDATAHAKKFSAILWASEFAHTHFHKLPAVMGAKGEYLSSKEAALVSSQRNHILTHGMRKWESGSRIFRGEAEHWRTALCALILVTAGMRPGELCRLRIGGEAHLFPASDTVKFVFSRLK